MHPTLLSDSPLHIFDILGKPENFNIVNERKKQHFGHPWCLHGKTRVSDSESRWCLSPVVISDLSLALLSFHGFIFLCLIGSLPDQLNPKMRTWNTVVGTNPKPDMFPDGKAVGP